MRAGRARPLRAVDMKKDVRILLVGERESAHRGWPRPPQTLPPLPLPSRACSPVAVPVSSIRIPGAPSPFTLPFRLSAGGPPPLASPGPS